MENSNETKFICSHFLKYETLWLKTWPLTIEPRKESHILESNCNGYSKFWALFLLYMFHYSRSYRKREFFFKSQNAQPCLLETKRNDRRQPPRWVARQVSCMAWRHHPTVARIWRHRAKRRARRLRAPLGRCTNR